MRTSNHIKDCELGDNWKDCPACREQAGLEPLGLKEVESLTAILKSRLKAAKRKVTRKPNAVMHHDHYWREWQMVRAIQNIRSGLFGRRKKP